MPDFSAIQTIRNRYSCRKYETQFIPDPIKQKLTDFFQQEQNPFFNTTPRLGLLAEENQDPTVLRGLGTYGFIKNPAGFIVGAVEESPEAMVDFGYVMELVVLQATDLGLGTCWLGGTFTKSTFAKKFDKQKNEILPAVIACGIPVEGSQETDLMRRQVRGGQRLPWSALFFDGEMQHVLAKEDAGPYQTALEMVRLAPSASNKQPWRVIKDGQNWHFILQRTPGYGKANPLLNLIGLADMQRIDMGIVLAHFELSARELGLSGGWLNNNPHLNDSYPGSEYILTWAAE